MELSFIEYPLEVFSVVFRGKELHIGDFSRPFEKETSLSVVDGETLTHE